jgi:hypothetical protein
MQRALNVVAKRAIKVGLNINPHKISIVPFTNRRKLEGLGPLILHGKELKMLDEVKYLGVTLESRLNWNQHLQKKIRKTKNHLCVS